MSSAYKASDTKILNKASCAKLLGGACTLDALESRNRVIEVRTVEPGTSEVMPNEQ